MQPSDGLLAQAFLSDDHARVDALLTQAPNLRRQLNRGVFAWNMPTLAAAKSREMVDVLVAHGATLQAVSQWWSPGFGVEQVDLETAQYLVQLGAEISIHAVVAMGWSERAVEMIAGQPELVHARGGDGCRPLHFCRRTELASSLLDAGAELDARDEDHDSTAAQWRIGDAPDVARLLLAHRATSDIFMAAALGDIELAKLLIGQNADCTVFRIGNNSGPFPGIGFQGRGGTIYQWSLGFNLSPHEVALKHGQRAIYELLLANSQPRVRLLVACTTANRQLAEEVLAHHPDVLTQLDAEDHALLAKFCWETNKDVEAVRLMLDVGFPVDTAEFNHGHTALHNAAWCGDPELVQLLIERGHPTDLRDPEHNATAIGFAIHSCLEAKRHPEGRFDEVVELLLKHGTPFDPANFPVGQAELDAVLQRHLQP